MNLSRPRPGPAADAADAPGARRLGTLLVALQLGLIGVLAVAAAPAFMRGHAPVGAWLLAAAGVGIGLWALSANRPGNFNVRPAPRVGGHLVVHGPYRWVRHPMYTSVLVLAAAAAWAAAPWTWAAAAALAAVLLAKARVEERWMAQRHPGYAAYCTRTRRFVPGIF